MPTRTLPQVLREEFHEYNASKLRQDVLAGITVAAVALPLALAFGVASGATAAAGLVTAILAGLVIGGLSGAPYQISGPTGAMSAVLIVLVNRYGLEGLWVAGLLSGALLTVIGLLRLGRFIAFIPAPVITGFTSGIAWIIAIGQIDNLLGVRVPRGELPVVGLEFLQESAALKMLGYLQHNVTPDWRTLLVGGVVIALMVLWPKTWNARFPASLLGIVAATTLVMLTGWDTPAIGAIPQTLLLDERLSGAAIPWANLQDFVAPALTITALGAVESLLCGAVASNMTGVRLAANVELIAQGVGNLLIPFFGGVPATAAIARTSVGIKSGGQTRLTSVVHALALLASMFVLAPVMARIPLAALAGVLIVTAWRMNEWEAIGYIFKHRLKTAMFTFAITMLATVVLDLTQAILIGAFLSGAVFLNQMANMNITAQGVDREKLRARGVEVRGPVEHVRVAYLTGPLFFAATGHFNEAFARLDGVRTLILSMRGVPLIDTSGLQALLTLVEKLRQQGGTLMLAGVHEPVRQMLERGGLVEEIGADNFFWSAEQAISEAARRISQNS
jgi:SulP family sulfate permease